MAVATSTMLAIGVGLSAASSISSGISAQKQAEANAEVYAQQAELAEAQGELEKFQTRQEIKSYENAAIAQSAMNSSSLSGTYLQNLNETYTNAEIAMGTIDYNTALTKYNYATQSATESASADAAFTQGLIGAGASVFTLLGKE